MITKTKYKRDIQPITIYKSDEKEKIIQHILSKASFENFGLRFDNENYDLIDDYYVNTIYDVKVFKYDFNNDKNKDYLIIDKGSYVIVRSFSSKFKLEKQLKELIKDYVLENVDALLDEGKSLRQIQQIMKGEN